MAQASRSFLPLLLSARHLSIDQLHALDRGAAIVVVLVHVALHTHLVPLCALLRHDLVGERAHVPIPFVLPFAAIVGDEPDNALLGHSSTAFLIRAV